MSPQTDPLERMLETLGMAQREGAFSIHAARYPWQAVGEVTAHARPHRRLSWLGVAIPLAAAAAVAAVFIWPSLFESRAVTEIAGNIPATVMPAQPEALAEAQPVAISSEKKTINCDYNGDGQIDGRDIQAFIDRVQEAGGSLDLEKDYLQRCLLGG
ncbi:MAG TPA: hypothetical protein VMV94_15730 [Phycisphaerae bacterium]|nr:hypothetical protein [Phycisphaerae bacterium]